MELLFTVRKYFCLSFLILISSYPTYVNASIEKGAFWIKSRQAATGQIYTPQTQSNPHQATAEAVFTLVSLNNISGINVSSALANLAPSATNNSTENLANLILLKHNLGSSPGVELSLLALRQQQLAGFGHDNGYESDPLSTAVALTVLAQVGAERTGIEDALQYAIATQKMDGSWSLENNTSNTMLTAQMMNALWLYRNTYAISSTMQKAGAYLLQQRNTNGLWQDLNSSAHALLALLNYFSDRSQLAASVAALQSLQLPDGSFNSDVYTTAIALRALYFFSQPAPDATFLAGRLIDGQTGHPLAGAKIDIAGVGIASTLTDANGKFSFKELQAGNYTLTASFQGYSPLVISTFLYKGSKPDLGTLKIGKLSIDPGTGKPVTTGTVRGNITDSRTGHPLGHVEVNIPALNLSAITDAAGNYQISNVPAGAINVSTAKAGYGAATGSANLAAQQTLIFSPTLREVIVLGVAIEGIIVEQNTNTPLAGTKVEILQGGNIIATAVTDPEGRYMISGLHAVEITISASLAGYHVASATTIPQDGTKLNFSPKLNQVSQAPIISKGGIVGSVIDAVTGRGIETVSVTLTYNSGLVINQVSGSDGEFIFQQLENGHAVVRLNLSGYQPLQASLTIQNGMTHDLGNIRFTPIADITSGKLFGHLVDVRTSLPITGGVVSIKNLSTNKLVETMSGIDGAFNFPVLPAASYLISVKVTGYTQLDFTVVLAAGDEIDMGEILLRKPGIDALIPDIAILAINRGALMSDLVSFNASGSLDVTVINRGNTAIEIPFDIYAFEDINKNNAYDSGDTLLGKSIMSLTATNPLKVDASLSTSIGISGKQLFRDAPVSIFLDATNVLGELSEANNIASTAGLCINQQKPNVDLALCMDSSGSISAADFKLQLEGTAQAIENVVPRDGSVRISVLQFDSAAKIEMNPTIVVEDNVKAITDKIRTIYKSNGGTAIDACINSAATLLSTATPKSSLQLIDVSTDGQSSKPAAVAASTRAVGLGVDVLNAIGVGTGIDTDLLNAIVFPQPIGGDRGFVLTVKNYQEYMNGISTKIQRETKIADLSLGGARLIDNGFGANASVKAIIGNGGASTISESIAIGVYDAAPEAGGHLVAEKTTTDDLLSGAHAEVTLDNIDPAKLTTGKLVIVAKLVGDFPECNQSNNRQEINAASTRGDIGLTLNGSTFGPNVNINLANVITNSGSLKGNFSVGLSIIDHQGFIAETFAPISVIALSPNTATTVAAQWNTGLSAAGSYKAVARLFDAHGVLLNTDQVIFSITELDGTGNGNPLGQVAAFADKPQYHIDDQVMVGYSIKNITRVHTISNPTVKVVVTSPAGDIVYENSISYASLLPGQILQWQQRFNLVQTPVGTYQVIATLSDSNNVVYGVGLATFAVVNNPDLALRGAVTVALGELESGAAQRCDYTSMNSGSVALDNQSIQYAIVNLDTRQLVSEKTKTISLVTQQSLVDQETFSTNAYAVGHYACVLSATDDSGARVLASSPFRVKESAIKLTGDIALGHQSRLLVLIDAAARDEKIYLQSLLDNNAWPHTIVDSATAFKTALTKGGYGAYLLLSGSITLDQATQDLLKQKVATGDGLLVAGSTDRHHQSLEQALGIKVRTNKAYAKGVGLQQSLIGDIWGRAFDKSVHVQPFTVNGATVIGSYRNQLTGADVNNVQGDLGTAGSYNAFFLENLMSLSSTIEGRLAVGGNLNLQSFSVGDKLNPAKINNVVTAGRDVIFPAGRIYYGNLIAGGSVAGVGNAVRAGLAAGASITGNTPIPFSFTGEGEYLQELSTNLAALPATGTVTLQWGGYSLKGNCTSNLQVFNINAAELATVHTFAVSCIPAGATVIFNILGPSSTIKGVSMESLAAHRDRVLFNFPQAKTLKLANVAIEGSIFAPLATIEQPAGRVEGQVIAKSWLSSTSGYMSIHNRTFVGNLSAAMGASTKNAVAHHQYQQGKTIFAGFDLLDQAHALADGDTNPFGQFLLAAIAHINPDAALARAGKVIPVIVTIENAGTRFTIGQATVALGHNFTLIDAAVANTTEWNYAFNLAPLTPLQKTFYVQVPATASATAQLKLLLQTGVAPDLVSHFEKSISITIR